MHQYIVNQDGPTLRLVYQSFNFVVVSGKDVGCQWFFPLVDEVDAVI